MKRLGWVDAVRGIGALAVVLTHTLAKLDPAYDAFAWGRFHLGYFGVVAFLFVSGYVVTMSLERSGSLLSFWRSRFLRLFPLYWFAILVATALCFAGIANRELRAHLWVTSAVNMTMLQDFFGTPQLVGVAWTLTVELVFYALLSLLFGSRLLDKARIWAIVALASFAVLSGFGKGALAICYAAPFVGILAYRGDKWFWPMAAGFASISAVSCFFSPTPGLLVGGASGAGLFALAYAVQAETAVTSWLGRISYSVYLLHPFITGSFALFMRRFHAPAWAWGAFVFAATLCLAELSFRLIETPFNELGKRLRKKQTEPAFATSQLPAP